MPRKKIPKTAWDGHKRFVEYHGQTIEAFTRSAVAKALNRAPVTIRALESKGVLCHPRLRKGTGPKACWLYTRDQIEDLIKLAKEEDLLNPNLKRHYTQRFVDEAHMILRRLPRLV